MFVPKINRLKYLFLTIGIVLFSSAPVGIFSRPTLYYNVALASPVTADKLTELTNRARADNGLVALTVNALLVTSAQGKANDMIEKNYFAHTSPEGLSPWYWFKLVGYTYTYAGENLAKNFATAEGLFQAWMASPTHRANILSPNYKEIGIAVATDEDTLVVAQHFGARTETAGTTTGGGTTASTPAPLRDTTAPVINFKNPQNGMVKQGDTVGFSLDVEGDPVAVTAKVGEKSVALVFSDGRWTGEITLYAGGTFDVLVEAIDAAGNKAETTLGTITVEIPEFVRETSDTRTLVAAYWKDVARNEAAPISLALFSVLAVAVIGAGYVWEKRRLMDRILKIAILPALLK